MLSAAVRADPLDVAVALPPDALAPGAAVRGARQRGANLGVVGAGPDHAAAVVRVQGSHIQGGTGGAVQCDAVDGELKQARVRARHLVALRRGRRALREEGSVLARDVVLQARLNLDAAAGLAKLRPEEKDVGSADRVCV